MTTLKWNPGMLVNQPQVALPQVHTDNLGEVLSGGANTRVAFFTQWDRDAVARTLVGMCNSQGGTVILGVGLDGILLGLASSGFWEEAVGIGDALEPSQKVMARKVRAGDSEVITLEVERAASQEVAFEGQVFQREGFLTLLLMPGIRPSKRRLSKRDFRSFEKHYLLDANGQLGSGGQARVMRATHRLTGHIVAFKQIHGVNSGGPTSTPASAPSNRRWRASSALQSLFFRSRSIFEVHAIFVS